MIGFRYDLHPPIFLGVLVILFAIGCVVFKLRKKRWMSTYEWATLLAFQFYVLSLIKVTILPISVFYEDVGDYSHLYYNLIPFKTISTTLEHGNYIQVVGNILLLLPLPILWSIYFRSEVSLKKALVLLLGTIFMIESIQLMINLVTQYPNKVADIDDVMLNALGGIVGWAILAWVQKSKRYTRYMYQSKVDEA